MPHQIETMAYVGQTPWHGLGNQLEPDQPLEVWLKHAGMDWQIESSPVRFLAGSSGFMGEIKEYAEKTVLFRSDTQMPLSVVSNRYKVVQPGEILAFYRDLTDATDMALETAGALKGGRKLWALARTGQSATLKGKDTTNAYVLLATACDGSMATTAQFTSVRVVCNNTLAVATASSNGAVKIPHSTTFDPVAVKQQLGLCASSWDDFMYRMKKLSERRIKNQEVQPYFQRVFTEPGRTTKAVKPGERSLAKVLSLYQGQGQGATLSSASDTAYGLLNAVTEFVDHERRAKSPDHRLDSAWFGQGATLKKKALEEALLLAA